METRFIKRLIVSYDNINHNNQNPPQHQFQLVFPLEDRNCDEKFIHCIKIVDHLIMQHVETYSMTSDPKILLIIRGLWMLRKHPKLFVRNGQWEILMAIAASSMEEVGNNAMLF
jgi:hypothetical protein